MSVYDSVVNYEAYTQTLEKEQEARERALKKVLAVRASWRDVSSIDTAQMLKNYSERISKMLKEAITQCFDEADLRARGVTDAGRMAIKSLIQTIYKAFNLPLSDAEDFKIFVKESVAPKAIKRKLKASRLREFEYQKIKDGDVKRYCSNDLVFAHRRYKNAMRKYMSAVYMTNDEEQIFTLWDLSSRNVSNPVVRRAEMLCRIKGFDKLAEQRGWTWTFVTLTCPSKYHPISEKWSGATPREAQQYLCSVWARIRAKLARGKFEYLGYRVAEPHRDGCPHWHLIMWAKSDDLTCMEKIINDYALREDGEEAGASKNRVKFERCDPSRNKSAIGYIIKYVSKNIDGASSHGGSIGDVHDRNGDYIGDAIEAAERIAAWASCWGIRQFQEIGGYGVSIYRELRRCDAVIGEMAEAWAAAKSGDYATYNEQAEQLQLQLEKEERETWAGRLYKRVVGVSMGCIITRVFTRWREWQKLNDYDVIVDIAQFQESKNAKSWRMNNGTYEYDTPAGVFIEAAQPPTLGLV